MNGFTIVSFLLRTAMTRQKQVCQVPQVFKNQKETICKLSMTGKKWKLKAVIAQIQAEQPSLVRIRIISFPKSFWKIRKQDNSLMSFNGLRYKVLTHASVMALSDGILSA